MDLTTLALAVMVAIGLLGADAVVYSGAVEVEVAAAPTLDKVSIDTPTLATVFEGQLDEITKVPSVVRAPEIRASSDQGIGMALAEAVSVQKAAYALKEQLGYKPQKVRMSLYMEGGVLQALVSGDGHSGGFREVMAPNQGESVIAFVRRCAVFGASELAPYTTALYLLQKHASDRDFRDVEAIAEHAKAVLPPTPANADRALFDNLLGLVALFKNDAKAARTAFDAAMVSDPANPVPFLNAAFTDLQLDENQKAAQRMSQLIRLAPPANPVLRATAYLTWGAALLGLHDLKGADRTLAKATQVDPTSATAFGLWSEERQLSGDQTSADRFNAISKQNTATFENYGEVAALYFHLSWQDNQPLSRSNFANPSVVTLH